VGLCGKLAVIAEVRSRTTFVVVNFKVIKVEISILPISSLLRTATLAMIVAVSGRLKILIQYRSQDGNIFEVKHMELTLNSCPISQKAFLILHPECQRLLLNAHRRSGSLSDQTDIRSSRECGR
jgi:hypothetical protein